MSKWQYDLIENYKKYLISEDELIDEYDCFRCGGRCCFNTEVLIYPYDIWRIVHNQQTKNLLGLETSHDLFMEDSEPARRMNVKGSLLKTYLGENSHLPVASVNMTKIDKNLKVCPFNKPVKLVKHKKDWELLRKGRFSEIEWLKSESGYPAGVCLLEQAKPLVCRSYPLGRIIITDADKGTKNKLSAEEIHYIHIRDEHCQKYRIPGKELKVKDYIKKWGLDIAYKYQDQFNSWLEALKEKVKREPVRYIIGQTVYDFDLPAIALFSKKRREGKKIFLEEVMNYRPSSFDELMARSWFALSQLSNWNL